MEMAEADLACCARECALYGDFCGGLIEASNGTLYFSMNWNDARVAVLGLGQDKISPTYDIFQDLAEAHAAVKGNTEGATGVPITAGVHQFDHFRAAGVFLAFVFYCRNDDTRSWVFVAHVVIFLCITAGSGQVPDAIARKV